jgi:hypothetical protein
MTLKKTINILIMLAMVLMSCGEHDPLKSNFTDGGVQSGYQMSLTTFTIDKRTVSQNELFTIRSAMKNVATLDAFPGGQIGTALIDDNDNIIIVIGSRSLGVLNAGATSSAADAYNFVPDTIAPGQYKLRIVIRPTGGDWKLVTLSMVGDDVPTINFTVTPAESVETDDGYGLALTSFSASKTTVSQNEAFTVNSALRNVAASDTFPGGQIGTALVNSNGNIAAIIGLRSRAALNPGATAGAGDNHCYVPSTTAAGTYSLKTVIRPSNGVWRVAAMSIGNAVSSIDFTVVAAAAGETDDGYGMALTSFTTSETTVSQNELFTVSSAFRNVALDAFPGGQVGTALVNSNGSIAAIIGSRSRSALNSGSTVSAGANNCYVPSTVAAGQYKLRTAIKPNDGEWGIATLFIGDAPNAIDLTVRAESGAPGGGYGLALTSFSASKTTVSQNETFTVSSAFKNVGLEAFPGGQVGTALVNSNGNIAAIIGTRSRSALNSGSTASAGDNNCYVHGSVAPGQYKLRTAIKSTNGDWRIATMSIGDAPSAIDFTVTSAGSGETDDGYGLALTSFSASKTTVSQNELFTVSSAFKNVAMEAFQSGGQAGTALVDNNGNIKAIIGARTQNAVNSGSTASAGTNNCYVPDSVAPGQYKLRTVIKPANGDWRIATMSVGDVSSSIDLTVSAESGAPGGGYGLALTSFTANKTTVSQNESFTVSSAFRNVALSAFQAGGQVGIALVNNNGDIAAIVGTRTLSGAVNVGATTSAGNNSCYVPDTVTAGQYKLRAAIKSANGDWRIATMSVGDIPSSIDFTVSAESGTPGGGYDLALTRFETSKTTVSQNEAFTVTSAFRNMASAAFPANWQVGTALVNNEGDIVAIVGTRTQSGALSSGATTSAGTNYCYVPSTIAAGTYKLRNVIKPVSGAWRIATLTTADNILNGIDFTVTSAISGETDDGYGLALTKFKPNKTTVSQNEAFIDSSAFRNISLDAFPANRQIGTALIDNNGNIAAIVGIRTQSSAINIGSTASGINNCYVPDTVVPGRYRLRSVIRPAGGDWRIVTMSVDVPNSVDFTVTRAGSGAPGGGYGLALTGFSASKTTVLQNEAFNVSPSFMNISLDAFPGGQVGVALVNSDGNIVEVIKAITFNSLASGLSRSSTLSSCTIPATIPSGQYSLRIVVGLIGEEWRIATLSLAGAPNSINFRVERDNSSSESERYRKSANTGEAL